jgi:hypothetical protein
VRQVRALFVLAYLLEGEGAIWLQHHPLTQHHGAAIDQPRDRRPLRGVAGGAWQHQGLALGGDHRLRWLAGKLETNSNPCNLAKRTNQHDKFICFAKKFKFLKYCNTKIILEYFPGAMYQQLALT